MRIAIIADIHGNLVALETVARSIADDAVDQIVCLGDVAATGPQPREAIARLRERGCRCVMGNADAELLQPIPMPEEAEPRWLAIDRWCAAQLVADDLAFLRSFPPTALLDLGAGHTVLALHGSPQSFDDENTVSTSDDAVQRYLSGKAATDDAGGHTHTPYVRPVRDGWLLNPGSVGLRPPSACYALVESSPAGLSVTLRALPLDVDAVLAAKRSSGMPEYDWWSRFWITPESEERA